MRLFTFYAGCNKSASLSVFPRRHFSSWYFVPLVLDRDYKSHSYSLATLPYQLYCLPSFALSDFGRELPPFFLTQLNIGLFVSVLPLPNRNPFCRLSVRNTLSIHCRPPSDDWRFYQPFKCRICCILCYDRLCITNSHVTLFRFRSLNSVVLLFCLVSVLLFLIVILFIYPFRFFNFGGRFWFWFLLNFDHCLVSKLSIFSSSFFVRGVV